MFWMETLIVVGLALAMAAVLALMLGPLGEGAGSFQGEDPFELGTNTWPQDHNTRSSR